MQSASRESLASARDRLEDLAGGSTQRYDEAADGLFAVAGLLHREHTLRRALAEPATAPDAKADLVSALVGDQLPDVALELTRHLVRARWSVPGDLVDAADELAVTAVFGVAELAGDLDEVEDELFRFARLVDREPALRRALTDPALPADRKVAVLRELLSDRARPATVRLLEHVATAPRARSLDAEIDHLVALAAERRSQVVAQVRVAVPLDGEQSRRLAAALRRIYDRDVALQVEVDPSVVGGGSVRIGDDVFDGTIARRLDEVSGRLTGRHRR